MTNPLISKPEWLTAYLIWWMLPGSIHSFVLSKGYGLTTNFIVVDSFVSFFLLSIFGLSIWYLVRFSNFDKTHRKKSLYNLLASMFLIFFIWSGLAFLILNLILPDYKNVFSETFLWRGLIFLPIYLLIISVYLLLNYQEKIKNYELEETKMDILLKETELKALKAQINPHFLFNSLNSASSLTISNPSKAQKMIIMISDFFRGSLLLGKKSQNTVAEEIEHALLYLEIEKARFGDKIMVEIDLPEEIKDINIPTLLLQPIVENAVKHGVYESSIPIVIQFRFENRESDIIIKISNNLDKTAGNSGNGTGTGLQNVASRLALAYGRTDFFEVKKSEDEFVVKMIIPKIKNLVADE